MMLRALIVMVCVLLAACGYTFKGSGSVLPPDVKKIYIPMVENNSIESSLSQVLTEALRDQFDRYGAVSVVEDMVNADAVLYAKVITVKKDTRSSTSRTDLALQQETSLTISAELRRVTGPVLWREQEMTVQQSYGSTAGSVLTSSASFAGGTTSAGDLANLNSREVSRSQEQDVINTLSEELSRKVYEAAVAPDF